MQIDIEKAKLHPAKLFSQPQDVITNQDLSDQDKQEILTAWKNELEIQNNATDEGMPGKGSVSQLENIGTLLQNLDADTRVMGEPGFNEESPEDNDDDLGQGKHPPEEIPTDEHIPKEMPPHDQIVDIGEDNADQPNPSRLDKEHNQDAGDSSKDDTHIGRNDLKEKGR